MTDSTNIHSLPYIQHQANEYLLHNIFTIFTNNVISFANYIKHIQIVNEASLNRIDILGLSETNITSKESLYIKKELSAKYIFLYNNNTSKFKPKGFGVALLINQKYTPYITSHKGKKGRYIYINFLFKNHNKIYIYQIYLYANLQDISERTVIQTEIIKDI